MHATAASLLCLHLSSEQPGKDGLDSVVNSGNAHIEEVVGMARM
jgi:hypothetical protein